MKKLFVVALALGLFALPVMAQVEAGAGKITVHADVDFLGRYIGEDDDAERVMLVGNTVWIGDFGQAPVEDLILRDAILSLQGELSDKVAWELTAQQFGLLTAKIQLKMIPMTTLTFGRFLIDQSPSLNYHILGQTHFIYFPMAANAGANYGSSENLGNMMSSPLLVPGWQTGAQAQIGNDMVHLTLGWFDGVEAGLQETNNNKAGLVGLHVNASGIIGGLSWWDEYSNSTPGLGGDDSRLNIYDFYLGYKSEKINVLAEYLENSIDPLDGNAPVFRQNDWYIQLAGFIMDPLELVLRYETLDHYDLMNDDGDFDVETNLTIGVNYFLVDKNAAIALQYVAKDHDELDWNDSEIDLLVEVDI